jgi:hypothetical protein
MDYIQNQSTKNERCGSPTTSLVLISKMAIFVNRTIPCQIEPVCMDISSLCLCLYMHISKNPFSTNIAGTDDVLLIRTTT